MKLGMTLAAILALGLCSTTWAQEAGGGAAPAQPGPGGPGGGPGGPGGRARMSPEQMRERMADRMKEALGVNDEEWKALAPKVEKVQQLQFQTMMGRGRMFGRGGPGAGVGPGFGANMPSNPVLDATRALQTTLENKDSTPDQIKAKLTALRDARAKSREELTVAQNELKELLTQRQEAVLVSMGMLE